MPGDLARELADIKALLLNQSQRRDPQLSQAEIERIAEGISQLQSQTAQSLGVDALHGELDHIRNAIDTLSEAGRSLDTEAILRSIESGYERIAGRLEADLLQGPAGVHADEPRFDRLTGELQHIRGAIEMLPGQLSLGDLDDRLAAIADAVGGGEDGVGGRTLAQDAVAKAQVSTTIFFGFYGKVAGEAIAVQ